MQNPAPAQPAKADVSRAAFWQMLQRIAVLAGGVDIVFLIVFWLVGQHVMALVNLVSLATYGAAYALLQRRRNLPAVLLMWAEVLIHSSANTLVFGWETGRTTSCSSSCRPWPSAGRPATPWAPWPSCW